MDNEERVFPKYLAENCLMLLMGEESCRTCKYISERLIELRLSNWKETHKLLKFLVSLKIKDIPPELEELFHKSQLPDLLIKKDNFILALGVISSARAGILISWCDHIGRPDILDVIVSTYNGHYYGAFGNFYEPSRYIYSTTGLVVSKGRVKEDTGLKIYIDIENQIYAFGENLNDE